MIKELKSALAMFALTMAVAAQSGNPTTAEWTTADDHRNMMEQLGIKALRPGPSGNPSAPNQANYDEALANPFPELPALFTLKNGRTITKADQWWRSRQFVECSHHSDPATLQSNLAPTACDCAKAAAAQGFFRICRERSSQVRGHTGFTLAARSRTALNLD